MDKLSLFKEFVKRNPKLIKYVNNGEMSWQKFYEMYDLYGEEDDIWSGYLADATRAAAAAGTALGLTEILSWLKNVDLDSLKNGVESVQRVIGVVQDFSLDKDQSSKKEEYKPRPLYKNFED